MLKLFWNVGKLFWKVGNYFGRAGEKIIFACGKIILAGGKIILAGLVTTRQSHPVRAREAREFLNTKKEPEEKSYS